MVRHWLTWVLLLVVLGAATGSAPCAAQQPAQQKVISRVVLKSGEILTGRIVSVEQNELRLRTKLETKRISLDPKDPESWRENEFDDLVYAVAMAAWRADRVTPSPKTVWDKYDKAARKNRKVKSAWTA